MARSTRTARGRTRGLDWADWSNRELMELRLCDLGVPFVFMTGHSTEGTLPSDLCERPRLLKPIDAVDLAEAVAGL